MLWFDWDTQKAESNQRKHHVSFQEVATIFSDPLSHTYPDPNHSINEQRYITIGLSEFGNILVVAHTNEGDLIRIISARKATRKERHYYEKGE